MQHEPDFKIALPKPFSFRECLHYLDRGYNEVLHSIQADSLIKAQRIQAKKVLYRISHEQGALLVHILQGNLTQEEMVQLREDIKWWFDVERDLESFYSLLLQHRTTAYMSEEYLGLRLIGIRSIFEALCWCIIGQQINLHFAHQVKRNLVMHCGDYISHEGITYFIFPKPTAICQVDENTLKKMKFSRQKIRYIKSLARNFAEGEIQNELEDLSFVHVRSRLLQEIGIGNWTADYVLMRTWRDPNSVPYGDAGLINAAMQLGIIGHRKDHTAMVDFFGQFEDWKSYLAFYLWRALR